MTEREPQPTHVTQIKIKTAFEDIPDLGCIVCEGPTQKSLIELEWSYTRKGQPAVIKAELPGYSCEDHEGIDAISLKASNEFLKKAYPVVLLYDWETAGDIWASLVAGHLPEELPFFFNKND